MIMNVQEKRGIISLIAGFGVIAILIGIFVDEVEFGYGLVTGVACFILSGVVSTFLGISEDGETMLPSKGSVNARRALVSLIAGFGVIVILIGIFIDEVTFIPHALIVAIALFIFSGVTASFLGVSDEDKHCGRHFRQRINNQPSTYTAPVSEESYYKPKQTFVRESKKTQEKEDIYAPQVTKKYCHSCGIPMNPEDEFCYNCGAKSSI
ncbi:MAG: zinc ribbon domain-containing protein [Candidatus Hodarchaeales archaeon]